MILQVLGLTVIVWPLQVVDCDLLVVLLVSAVQAPAAAVDGGSGGGGVGG